MRSDVWRYLVRERFGNSANFVSKCLSAFLPGFLDRLSRTARAKFTGVRELSSLPAPCQVCPIERKQVLYEYGGVYADLDTVSSSDGTNFFITSSSKVAFQLLVLLPTSLKRFKKSRTHQNSNFKDFVLSIHSEKVIFSEKGRVEWIQKAITFCNTNYIACRNSSSSTDIS